MADRQTFAFQVGAPVEGATNGRAAYRGGDVLGGGFRGGDASPAAANPTDFGGQAGTFFDNLMKPYAERKAREAFIKGMTDQMYAEAGKEIRTGNGILPHIFGPSAYEEGAIFYEARARASKAQAEWQADEDELKQLPPNEVAKAWAQKLEQSKTGDPFTDDAIEKSLLEASGPMLQSVAKARYTWQQETTVKNQQVAWDQAADAFQRQAESFASTTSPSETDINGYAMALRSYTQGIMKPAGQEDESYIKSLTNSFRSIVQKGYGHAATALVKDGILDVLKPEDRVRLEDSYNKYGGIAIGEAAGEFSEQIDVLQGQIEFGQLTGQQIIAEYDKLNEAIKRKTGFDIDYFDTKDEQNAIKGVWDARRRAYEKQEARQWELQREAARQQFELSKDEARARAEAAAAEAAWRSANPGSAMVAGAVKADAMQARAYVAYQDNDFVGMDRAFKSGITSAQVKEQITSTVGSAVYAGYSQEFEGLHQKYRGMLGADPALAKEYFGQQWPAMLHYDKLLSGGATPAVAFAMAFGDDIQYTPNGDEVGKARKDVAAWSNEKGTPGLISRIFGGEEKLNTSGYQELANLIGREFATDNKYGGAALSNETLMLTAYTRAKANGQFEKYGKLGWANKPNTTPLYRIMQMQPQEASAAIVATIDLHLKNVGFAEGASADEYSIVRGRNNGKGVTIVVPTGEEGLDFTKTVVITDDEFVASGRELRKRRVSGYTPDAKQVQRTANKQGPLDAAGRGRMTARLEDLNQQLTSAKANKASGEVISNIQRQIDAVRARLNVR